MDQSLQHFLYGYASYRQSGLPEQQAFNRMLQYFSQRVMYLSNLHSNGKLSSEDLISSVDALWVEIEECKAHLDHPQQENLG